MRARAASMAPRAASPCTDGVARDAVDAASSLGGHRANVPRPLPGTPGLLGLQRCGLGGDAHPFTPSTRHVTNSGSRPSSDEPRLVPQARRDRFASTCASSSLGPWSDDPSASVGGRDRTISAARIRSGSTPGSCTRAFLYSPTVARFDPRQAGQTLNHGFPRWPVQKPSFRKNQQSAARRRLLSAAETPLFPPEKRGGISVDRKTRTFPNLCGYHTWLSPKRLGFESR